MSHSSTSRRIVVVLYAGDYRTALGDYRAGRREKYYGLGYAVEHLCEMAGRGDEVTVLSLVQPEPYDVDHPGGFRTVGLSASSSARDVRATLDMLDPTHLIVRTPSIPVLRWARRHDTRTITLLADSFPATRVMDRVRRPLLRRLLNGSHVDWVGNHGYPSCRALVDLGVHSSRVVPWDWPPREIRARPTDRRTAPFDRVELLYCGSVQESKGIGDLICALPEIAEGGVEPHLTVCGDGSLDEMRTLLDGRFSDNVDFLGRVPNEEVMRRLELADIAVVPSRHKYPEGYPLAILEALASRVPLVVSDHPMFRSSLVDRETAMVFPGGDAAGLAAKVLELARDPGLYEALRDRAGETHASLMVPLLWGEFIDAWLYEGEAGSARLHTSSLSTSDAQAPAPGSNR